MKIYKITEAKEERDEEILSMLETMQTDDVIRNLKQR